MSLPIQQSQSDQDLIPVLKSSLYVGASDASVRMVIAYCAAAKLDPIQKPVHIVPMWDSKSGGMRDVIMPGVNLYRIQAMRSGCAGITEPEYGPTIKTTLGGVEIEFPEWCRVTVKRQLENGTIAEFTAKELWLENYAEKGGKDKSKAPNSMWSKRPFAQLAKCAEAQALRRAFPEIAFAPTAEEMAGKMINEHHALPTQESQSTESQESQLRSQIMKLARDSGVKLTDVAGLAKSAGIEVEVIDGRETLPLDSLRQVVAGWHKITATTESESEMSDESLM